jgi:hypothetical protein
MYEFILFFCFVHFFEVEIRLVIVVYAQKKSVASREFVEDTMPVSSFFSTRLVLGNTLQLLFFEREMDVYGDLSKQD